MQRLRTFLAHVVMLSLISIGAADVRGDWVDDFDGGLHLPWTFLNHAGTTPPPGTDIRNTLNTLQMIGRANSIPNVDQFVVGIPGLGNPAFSFTDVHMLGTTYAPQGTTLAGATAFSNNQAFFITRTQADGRSGYLVAVDFSNGDVDLVRSDASVIVELNASGTIPNFSNTRAYTVELIAQGTQLAATIYDDAVPVVTLMATDSTYTSGWSGVGSSINTSTTLGFNRTLVTAGFDDVLASSLSLRPGDFNSDGSVNRTDVAMFASFFGATSGATPLTGDLTGDGRVGLVDLAVLQDNLSPPGSVAAVPEPATWLLALPLVVAVYARRRLRS